MKFTLMLALLLLATPALAHEERHGGHEAMRHGHQGYVGHEGYRGHGHWGDGGVWIEEDIGRGCPPFPFPCVLY